MYLIILAKRMLINANYALCGTKVNIIYRVSFLFKSNCRWSIKKYFWNAGWRSWRFPVFWMFQIRTKSFSCACMTGIKLNIRASLWNWDHGLKFFYYEIRKEVYPPRKIKFFNPRPKCFYSLGPGWCSVQKTVTVFSEKWLKFFTINVFCTQVHSQWIWCSAQICNSFKGTLMQIWKSPFMFVFIQK